VLLDSEGSKEGKIGLLEEPRQLKRHGSVPREGKSRAGTRIGFWIRKTVKGALVDKEEVVTSREPKVQRVIGTTVEAGVCKLVLRRDPGAERPGGRFKTSRRHRSPRGTHGKSLTWPVCWAGTAWAATEASFLFAACNGAHLRTVAHVCEFLWRRHAR
jgi:hypothetical protein